MKRIFVLPAILLHTVVLSQNVGIGLNTNINEKLTVKGNGLFTYISPTTKESGTTNLKIQSGPIGDGLVTFIKPDSSVQASIHYNSTYGTLELNAGASINQFSLNNNGKVGIGIRSVYPGAAFQIESQTAGLLIPRMSTTQRNAINGLIDGLMVYNNTTSKLNQWQAGAWREVLNTESWYGGGTGQMWNIGDRVGINTAGPTERLDVSGNIRSNSSVIIDNTSAILQLRRTGDDIGFVQLSGDNLRLGTNSGNDLGKIVLRTQGADQFSFEGTTGGASVMRMNASGNNVGILQGLSNNNVTLSTVNSNGLLILNSEVYINGTSNRTGLGTSTPEQRLHVVGNTKITGELESNSLSLNNGELNRTVTGTYNLVPVCYGRVTSSGSYAGGTPNVTTEFVTIIGNFFRIRCDAITPSSVVQITVAGNQGATVIPVVQCTAGIATIKFFGDFLEYDFGPSVIGSAVSFHFVVYNP